MVRRRRVIKRIGAAGTLGLLAGCSGDGGSGSTPTEAPETEAPTDATEPTEASTPTESGPTVTFNGNEELNINLSPSVPQENLYVQYGPLRDHLEGTIQENYDVPEALDASMNVGTNYSAVIQALGQGTADLAETGPFGAAVGYMTDNSEVILQRHGYGAWTYKSLIAVPNDSDIEAVADLEGKTVAFSDSLSTSGFLYPVAAMKEAGIDIGNLPEGNGSQAAFEPVFAGGHVQSYNLIEQDQADAAGMGGFVRDTGTGPSPDGWSDVATTLHEDTGLPRAPFVVSAQLPDETKEALQQTILNAPDRVYYGADGEEGGGDDLWFNDVREADIDTYQSVIDKAETLGIGADFFE